MSKCMSKHRPKHVSIRMSKHMCKRVFKHTAIHMYMPTSTYMPTSRYIPISQVYAHVHTDTPPSSP